MVTPMRVIRRPDSTLILFGDVSVQAYKLSQPDVGRIEQRFGRPLDFISQDELESALDGLHITQLPLDAADRTVLGPFPASQPAGGTSPRGYPASPPPPAPSPAEPGVTPTVPLDYLEPEPSGANRWLLIGAAVLTVAAVLICALVFFSLRSGGSPNATPTPGLEGTAIAPTAQPGIPMVTAITNAPLYAGPGSVYPSVGTILAGQTAEVVGRSAEQTWWVIRFPAAASGQAWVAATLVESANTDNVPVVAAPPTPRPTSTPAPPVAVISGPSEALAGEQLTFSGDRSTAAPGSSITNYAWDFGNGTTAQGHEVTVIYSGAGTFQITLTVTDDRGLQGQTRQSVNIAAPTATTLPVKPPVAVISGPGGAFVDESVTFDGGGSSGSSPIVRYTWDFSDGSGANGMVVDHVFRQAGTYTIVLNVQDANGLVGSTSQPIRIETPATPVPTQPPPALNGTSWVLENTLPDTSITAAFQDGEFSGFAGCNTYTGTYTVNGPTLSIGGLQTTQQACSPEIMAQEQLYLTGFASAFRYDIVDRQLTIYTGPQNQPVLLTYTAAPP